MPTPHTGKTIVGTGASAGLTATLVTYLGCQAGSTVNLWRLTGSGHVWPGAPFNTGPEEHLDPRRRRPRDPAHRRQRTDVDVLRAALAAGGALIVIDDLERAVRRVLRSYGYWMGASPKGCASPNPYTRLSVPTSQ